MTLGNWNDHGVSILPATPWTHGGSIITADIWLVNFTHGFTAHSPYIDSIAVSAFVFILVEFDIYRI